MSNSGMVEMPNAAATCRPRSDNIDQFIHRQLHHDCEAAFDSCGPSWHISVSADSDHTSEGFASPTYSNRHFIVGDQLRVNEHGHSLTESWAHFGKAKHQWRSMCLRSMSIHTTLNLTNSQESGRDVSEPSWHTSSSYPTVPVVPSASRISSPRNCHDPSVIPNFVGHNYSTVTDWQPVPSSPLNKRTPRQSTIFPVHFPFGPASCYALLSTICANSGHRFRSISHREGGHTMECKYCGSPEVRRSYRRSYLPISLFLPLAECDVCNSVFRVPFWTRFPTRKLVSRARHEELARRSRIRRRRLV